MKADYAYDCGVRARLLERQIDDLEKMIKELRSYEPEWLKRGNSVGTAQAMLEIAVTITTYERLIWIYKNDLVVEKEGQKNG